MDASSPMSEFSQEKGLSSHEEMMSPIIQPRESRYKRSLLLGPVDKQYKTKAEEQACPVDKQGKTKAEEQADDSGLEKLIQALKGTPSDANLPLTEDTWHRSLAWRDLKFAECGKHHPHMDRKLAILKRYPIIRKLFGVDPYTKWIILAAVADLLLMSWHFGHAAGGGWGSTIFMLTCAYVIGATLQGVLDIATHECCHGLVAESPMANVIFNLILNMGMPVPMAMSFDKFHPLHHAYQGDKDKDPDIPMPWEMPLVKGRMGMKFLEMFLAPLMYSGRAVAKYGTSLSKWELTNLVLVIITDIVVYNLCGPRGLLFLFTSFFMGHTFHPTAAHFIQEHYTWQDGQETYNYYGWANTIYMNIGFHIEHHDFPTVAWSKLPIVTAIAYEFYAPLDCFRSWRRVLWQYLTDPQMGPVSRVVRPPKN